jgi:hypothetical protein
MNQWEVQKAIFNKLDTGLDIPTYDHVPQGATLPYVTIGEDTATSWDTDDSTGSESTLTIHVWTREAGRRDVKVIMNDIYGLLHRQRFAIDGSILVDCFWEFAETFMDPDGVTRHGVLRFRIIEENENE